MHWVELCLFRTNQQTLLLKCSVLDTRALIQYKDAILPV